jgi:hypothetical protein
MGFGATTANAYQKYGVRISGRIVELRWAAGDVRYYVTNRSAPGVSVADLQAAIGRAFATWQAVSTASVSFSFAGLTSADPHDEDGISTLGFLNEPELERVLGSTDFLFDTSNGEIVEAGIFFNSTFSWSVAQNGESGRFDLESIALHEIGHFLGLGHSALGETELRAGGGRRVIAAESVMFPIAFSPGDVGGRRLKVDDIAGVSDLYSEREFTRDKGTITGRVTRDGRGVFGAHIVAFNPATGELIGNFSLNDEGEFTIEGLSPGPHLLRVEPIDDADLDSFFDDTSTVDVDFAVAYAEQLVVAPPGGVSSRVEIKVTSK